MPGDRPRGRPAAHERPGAGPSGTDERAGTAGTGLARHPAAPVADPGGLGQAGEDGAGPAAPQEGDGRAGRGRGAVVPRIGHRLPRPDQRGPAHLHAGADLEGGAEPGGQEPARGRDLGEGAAEAEGGVRAILHSCRRCD